MSDFKRYLVTSALPYANGPIHLGHLAGAYLPADIYVRYCRLKKRDIIFICGSDEHGVPILLRSRSEKKLPQDIVDEYHNRNKKSFERFGISFDYYGRTSSEIHHQTSQDFFRELAEKNTFILKSEKQLFDPKAEMFLADRFIKGTCPFCKYEEAYGDQCEKCGSSLNPTDLINPRSAITDSRPVLKETTHWYLPLRRFQNSLEEWIRSHKEWKSNVLGQINSWFNEGLKDRAVTRDLSWGVSIPEDISAKYKVESKGKVLYVWFDAPIGYISATKEWAIAINKPEIWQDYWQCKDTKLVHFIGKDNIVFHCIIFPAMLMAHGKYILPDNVPANEFLNLEGDKLSTSRNYAVWLEEYLENFEPDSLRYCLTQNAPETKDSDFSWKDFQARHNNELADIIGNFVNRTFIFSHKYFEGKVPPAGKLEKLDKVLSRQIKKTVKKAENYFDNYQFRNGLKEIMDLCRFANKYFNDQQPWVTIKTDSTKCATTINLCFQTVKSISILIYPIMPFTSEKIWKLLGISKKPNLISWEDAINLNLEKDHKIDKPSILFEKIEDARIEPEITKLMNKSDIIENEEEPIDFADFKKLDLRVAKIIFAEKVKNSNKLYKIKIEIGDQEKTIVAGIAQNYSIDELNGKKIVVLSNLKPVQIRGVISEGMLLAAGDDNENISLLTLDRFVETGSKIK